MQSLDVYDDPELFDLFAEPSGRAASFYLEEARRVGGDALELACGTGRLAIPLAEAGVATAGIDIHEGMLARARKNAPKSGAHVDWIQADMRAFSLGRTFGLIFIANNSLLHLHRSEDIRQCFRSVARHLRPGGVFVLEIFNPSPQWLAQPRDTRFFVTTLNHPQRGPVKVEHTLDYDSASQINRETWYWSTDENPDFRVRPLHLRNIFPEELPLLMELSGLRIATRYEDYSRSPFHSGSFNQICLCEPA